MQPRCWRLSTQPPGRHQLSLACSAGQTISLRLNRCLFDALRSCSTPQDFRAAASPCFLRWTWCPFSSAASMSALTSSRSKAVLCSAGRAFSRTSCPNLTLISCLPSTVSIFSTVRQTLNWFLCLSLFPGRLRLALSMQKAIYSERSGAYSI